MGFHRFHFILVFIFIFNFGNHCLGLESCDWSKGSWVYDKSLPQYNNTTCPIIRKSWNCQGNGRPDTQYQKYRWQPTGCNLKRFNGKDFLKRFQGKHIMFVGDSLSQNQYGSLTCLLYSAVPNLTYNISRVGNIETFTVIDYKIKVSIDLSHYFVDIKSTPHGRILDLDSIEDGKNWLGVDTLVFNTWHWWFHKKPSREWDYVKDGSHVYENIDPIYALKRGLATWSSWLDANVNKNKTRVYFQGFSPNHSRGDDWGEPKASCLNQKSPIIGSKYRGPDLTMNVKLIKSTLKKVKVPVTLLDVTNLSLFRKDGHPSLYGQHGAAMMDCTHWCLSGVPDTWNEILYNFIISEKI